MANKRIKDITTASTSFASDDFVITDSATSGTRKMTKDNLISQVSAGVSGDYLEESNNLSDVASKDTAKLNLEVPNVGTAANEVPVNGMLNSGAWLDFDAFYEEGTWTPRISWLNGNTGLAQSNEGLYTRVGNIVSVRGRVALSDKGSDTGIAYLNDLPFTARNGAGNTDILIVGSASSFSGLTGSLSLTISKNTTTAVFRQMSSTGVAYVTDSSFSNTSLFVFSGTYQIA